MSSRLLLVRHRQSTWNAERRWTGQADPPLSPQGEADAAALGSNLAPEGFDAIVASDLTRARRTAELVGEVLKLPVAVDPRLREIDVPAWSGLPREMLHGRHGADYTRWRELNAPPPGAEPWHRFETRVLRALHDCAGRGGTVLVVAHSGVLRAARTALRYPRKVGRSKGMWVERRSGRLVAGPLRHLRPSDG